jgi:hypothetical protein
MKHRAARKWAAVTKAVQREIAIELSRKHGTIAATWPYAPRQFPTTNDALEFAKEKGHPIHIYVADAENKANDRLFKLWPD